MRAEAAGRVIRGIISATDPKRTNPFASLGDKWWQKPLESKPEVAKHGCILGAVESDAITG